MVQGERDRDEVFVEYTKSVCPMCKVVVDAQVNIRDNKVYLRKRCREHGWFEALVYGDAQAYTELSRFNKPGTLPLAFQTEVRDGCPSDCGLCPEHKQHACLGIIEVNTGCNLDCPICFADSGHQGGTAARSASVEGGGGRRAEEAAARSASVEGGGGRRAEEAAARSASVEGGGGRRAEEAAARSASVEGGGGRRAGYSITHQQCELMLDTFVAAEGEPEVVMFSGGEPTIHKNILDFIDLAQQRPIKVVNLNTNGIRLATDERFVAALGERNGRNGTSVNVYLQFDGFDEATHRAIRGRDLREHKRRALDNCAEAGLTVTLVAAVERGLNDHEVGDIIRFGIDHPAVRSVSFQPVTHSGRHVEFDPLTRLTNSDVIELVNEQCPDWFRPGDFFPVPCCFPTCRSITYLLVDRKPERTDVVPIPRLIDIDDHLDYVSNRVLPDPGLRSALEKLWSASAFMGAPATMASLETATAAAECEACGIDLPEAAKDLGDRAFMIVVQDFLDPYTLNVKQLMKCCVEEITPDGRIIPFCAYNSVGYREQVRAQMSGVEVADVVPNARELADVTVESPYGSRIARNALDGDGAGASGGTGIAPDSTNVGGKAVEP
ncbi:radical SAM protein [Spinactinospora alkalitolerans]|uniref:radical SAM protein n=1 Tax=Spinactinospora alkalitolerans TaxID=687207 RepID=UPI0028AF6796|nr:radical SAM protein [Spinactinospora alkalitolerans]